MCPTVRSKKMARWKQPSSRHDGWTYPAPRGPDRTMKQRIFVPDRRQVLAGLGASLGAPVAGFMAGGAAPLPTAQVLLQAKPATLDLRPGQTATPVWELAAASHTKAVHLRRGDICEVVFRNDLPVPLAPAWYGLNGAALADPHRGRAPTAPGATETSTISIFSA